MEPHFLHISGAHVYPDIKNKKHVPLHRVILYIYISIKSLYHARRIMTCVPNSPSVELCVFVAKADKASAAAARADDRKAQEALGWFV